jgi:alpha-beta hydrolase superfamily lysophospholipase
MIDHGTTRDGLIQLRRRWQPEGQARGVVLLLHGIGEHTGRYEHVGGHLAAAGFEVVGIDHRGYGQSGGRRAYVDSWSQFLDDVEDQLAEVRSFGLPTVMLGHSMGGLIAASYCVDERPLPDLLVLSGPALGVDIDAKTKMLTRIGPMIRRVAPGYEIRDDWDPTVFAADVSVGEKYMDDPLRIDFATISLGLELFGAIESTQKRLGSLSVPTMCVHGRDDKLVPVGASEPLEALGAHRIVYDGLGHEVFNEPSGLDIVDDVIAWIDTQL